MGFLDQGAKSCDRGDGQPLSGKHSQIQSHKHCLFLLEEGSSKEAPVSIQIYNVSTFPPFRLTFISDINHGTPILKSVHTYLPFLLQGIAKYATAYFQSPIIGFTIFHSNLLDAPCVLSFHNVISAYDFKGNEINMVGLTKEAIMQAISPELITILELHVQSALNKWAIIWKKIDSHNHSLHHLTTLTFS